MKRITALIALMISLNSYSCDVCGGISSPMGQGFLPFNKYHFVGFSGSYNSYRTLHRLHNSEQVEVLHEHFIASTLSGRWQIADRVNMELYVPFMYNLQLRANSKEDQMGLGDIQTRFNYLIINKRKDEQAHLLRASFATKFPTGKYSTQAWKNNNLFPGSGSYDFSIGVNYVFMRPRIGYLNESSFMHTTRNKVGYKYGDVFYTLNATLFPLAQVSKWKITPWLGIGYLYTDTDQISDIPVAQNFNNGHVVLAETGINLKNERWMFNFKASTPLFQYIGNGDVKNIGAIEIGLYYLIKKK